MQNICKMSGKNAFPEIVGRPDIIGTLYAGAGNSIPHANPQSNQFGRMVMKNMYRMQEILGVDIGSYYIDRESGKRVEILLS